MTLRKGTLLFLVAALAVTATPLLAQDICQSVAGNLVANCGFETGDFTGWTQSGNLGLHRRHRRRFAFSGNYAAYLGPIGQRRLS